MRHSIHQNPFFRILPLFFQIGTEDFDVVAALSQVAMEQKSLRDGPAQPGQETDGDNAYAHGSITFVA